MTDHCCLLMHNEFKYFMKVLFKIQVHSQIWPPPVANFTRPLGMGGVSKKELFRLTQIQIQLLKTVSPIMLWIAVAFLANMVASGSQISSSSVWEINILCHRELTNTSLSRAFCGSPQLTKVVLKISFYMTCTYGCPWQLTF